MSWRVDRQQSWQKGKRPPSERPGSMTWTCDLFLGPDMGDHDSDFVSARRP